MLAVGRNGAGKTNLLEALHLVTQGFSPRTRVDGQLIRFGSDAARVHARGSRAGTPVEVEVTLRAREGRRAVLNGAPLRVAEQLRAEVATLVFTPDRLAVVKGGPAVRRAYFDRALGRLAPARAGLPAEYGAAVGQRNAALRRTAAGLSTLDALAPWTSRVAMLGSKLVAARHELVAALGPPLARRAEELGLGSAAIVYEGEPPGEQALEALLARDLERRTTGLGPHLDDIGLAAGSRDLRLYGSQGEQRLAVLALLLAEADLIVERSGVPPLLLLDDVLSELDRGRREALARQVAGRGQTVVTTTSREALPGEASQVLAVEPGRVFAAS